MSLQRFHLPTLSGVMLVFALLTGCGGGTQVTDTSLSGWTRALPAGFPTPLVPADNPISEAKIELGRHLFYDMRLSGNGTQACGSCHHQAKAFTNGAMTAVGSTGDVMPRNVPSLGNVAYNATYTWANFSITTLERHHLVPLFNDNPTELGVNDANQSVVLARFAADPLYQNLFAKAFPALRLPADLYAWATVTQALASFTRSLISGNSKYDQFMQGTTLLTASELRGMNLFNTETAECFHCHGSFNFNDSIQHEGMRYIDRPFHNTGLYNVDGLGSYPAGNQGIFELSQAPTDKGRFRAPSLRNVEVTAPYMHDGSKATLEAVIDHYAAGGSVLLPPDPNAGDGRSNPYKDGLIGMINLTVQDKADLVAFLKTLTDNEFLTHPCLGNPFYPDPAHPCLKAAP
jgi:cytochrome c peroxidase